MTIEYSKDYLRTLKRITKKRTLSSETIDSTIDMYLADCNDVRLKIKGTRLLLR